MDDAATARLMLVLLSLCWGLSWSAMRIALYEVSPWTMRFMGYSIGAAILFALIKLQRRSLVISWGRAWLHILAASAFIVISFGVAGTFAQLMAETSRVIIVTYSMPVWGSLLAWLVLRERINLRVAIGLSLCLAGISVLVFPALETSIREPIGLLLALVCALTWAGGTVYMKWARIPGDLLAITFWQIVVGIMVFGVCYLVFEGAPKIVPLRWDTWAGIIYNGVFGTGFAYFIWFNIIGRLSTAAASLGTLSNPVVGIIGAAIMLGDRPTTFDMIGFALMFGASACVLIPSRWRARRN